jgi:hypothetical protein
MRRTLLILFVLTIMVLSLGNFEKRLGSSLNNSVHAGGRAAALDAVTASFSAPTYEVNEGAQKLDVTVTLSSPAPNAMSVDYETAADVILQPCVEVSGIGSERCDFTTTLGTLRFGAGEQSKTFSLFVTDDSYVEGAETFTVSLSSPTGGVQLATQPTAIVTITDNDSAAGAPNPVDEPLFFVRQHYIDFLNRSGEQAGVDSWVNQLTICGDSLTCNRVAVSSAFFGSQEFMLKGDFVFRAYQVCLNEHPNYREFTRDSQRVTGATAEAVWAARDAYMHEWMSYPEFKSRYDSLSNHDYVLKLEEGAKGPVSNESSLIDALDKGTMNRESVAYNIVESPEVKSRLYNEAFVMMEYWGYLRRDPEPAGYQAWLGYLNENPDRYREMVRGFVDSVEYRMRFGKS